MTEPVNIPFSSVGLAESILRAVAEKGYTTMSPIQAAAIPHVLAGRDVMGAAQTGTGKTAAFVLPLLQRMLKHETSSLSPARHPVRALVLTPTRELADQIQDNVKQYAKYTQLRSTVVFGGIDIKPQIAELRKGVEILTATPGRLLDHIEMKSAVLNQVEYVVLDEADRMLDIGFLPDLQRILSFLPKQRITLLFSATFSPEIKRLAATYLQNPILVEVARPNETATNVEQLFFSVHEDDKSRVLRQLVRQRGITQAFVFCNSKLGCARLARSLERDGLRTTALHGDKSQDERLKALEAFKKGGVDLLVATDVAARGLDIKDVPAVFNYDIPFNAEDYVHRIGRTGRAGASGLALSFVDNDDKRLIADIEKLIKKKVEFAPIEMESENPRRGERFNSGRRAYGEDGAYGHAAGNTASDKPAERSFERREDRGYGNSSNTGSDSRRSQYPSRPARQSADPFFSKPYEAPAQANPSWDSATPATATASRVSANIKSKKRVAALFKASESELAAPAASTAPALLPQTSAAPAA
jgi:ATP-dependent RNA helicase RhlE